MDSQTCPICERDFKDILKHLVIFHEIMDMGKLNQIVTEKEKQASKRLEFGKYVDELNEKIKKGDLSAEDFRILTSKWWKEH